ncbi:MAG: CoA transferase [Pseudomonadota bacterium]
MSRATGRIDAPSILDGVRVLDIASYIAAPISTTVMADFGADVIKVEPPSGDVYRRLTDNPGLPEADVDYHWQVDNRNKRGIALNLRCSAGQRVLERLIETADVLVTNFTPPARKKLKLRWEDVSPRNPRLIYASLSAYGETGPEAEKTGFDSTAYWARTGLMHMVRPEPTAVPARSLPGQGDHPTGLALFGAIMLALYDRERTGEGAQVHSSLLANGLWSNAFYAQAVLSGGNAPMRPHRREMPNALTNHYRCQDDHWFILSLVDQEKGWIPFLQAIEREELASDPRFATREARTKNAMALIDVLDRTFASKDYAQWRTRLDAAGVTFGSVGRVEEIPNDEQMLASGCLVPTQSRAIGASHVIDTPLWVEGRAKQRPEAAPTLGQHNGDLLAELGFSSHDIEELTADGAFAS